MVILVSKAKPYKLPQVEIRMVKTTSPLLSAEPISSPEAAVRALADIVRDYDREIVACVTLSTSMHPINMSIISKGILNQTLIHPREVLKTAILSNANSIMIFHTHPSGSLNPSREDIAMTYQLQKACALMNIPMIDHIILGRGNQYYSFREKNILPMDKVVYATKLDDINLNVAEKKSVGKRLQEKKEIVEGSSVSKERVKIENKMQR